MGILTKGKYTFGNKTQTQIGQLTTPQNLTGTAVIGINSNIITGTGTLFTQEVFIGDCVKFATAGYVFIVSAVNSNTQLTVTTNSPAGISSQTLQLANPKRIKFGDSVFNTTDGFPMYYSGDNTGLTINPWRRGEFCNGQIVPITSAAPVSSYSQGAVLQNSSTVTGSIEQYSSGVNSAIAVCYFATIGSSCVASGVAGIQTTNSSGTVTKGNFTQPNSVGANVVDDGATSTAGNSGIAATSNGTPAATQIKMLVNFTERL